MNITWNRDHSYMYMLDKPILCSCVVRNNRNGLRPSRWNPPQDEVVLTIPDGKPYMPDMFPRGTWKIGRPVARKHPYKAPYYVPTNATRLVTVWSLDGDGGYYRPTNETVTDEDYGLHCSTSSTTLGCIRIHREEDLTYMLNVIWREHEAGRDVVLEVT